MKSFVTTMLCAVYGSAAINLTKNEPPPRFHDDPRIRMPEPRNSQPFEGVEPVDPISARYRQHSWNSIFSEYGDGFGAMSHSCDGPINMVKAGADNFLNVLGTGQTYSDSAFPPTKDEMIWWPSNPRRDELSFRNF